MLYDWDGMLVPGVFTMHFLIISFYLCLQCIYKLLILMFGKNAPLNTGRDNAVTLSTFSKILPCLILYNIILVILNTQ